MKFSIKDFFSKCEVNFFSKSSVSEDLVTFTEVILNGKLHFLCSVSFTPNPLNLRDSRCLP